MTETNTTTEVESDGTVDDAGGIPWDGMEDMLKGLKPSEPSADLMAKLSRAFEAVSESPEAIESESTPMPEIIPVSVPVDKLNRWVKMMDNAAREATEERLRNLKANQPTEFKLMRWLMSVENTSIEKESEGKVIDLPPRKRMRLWAMSAAATFLILAGVLSLYPSGGKASSLVQQGDINRETVNVVEKGIQWNAEKGLAERTYQVKYKDSVEVIDHNGTQMNISVPATETVVVPVEIY